MDDKSSIEPAFLQLSELFDDGRYGKFLVPDYQRGFDWNQGHVDDLWEDIEYYLKKDIEGARQDFFLGSIILKTPDENEQHFEVVDGQQRLTSLYLLSIAIRNRFKELGCHDEVRDVDRDFLNFYDDNKKRSPKFLGTKKIREFLKYISDKDWNQIFPTKDDLDQKIHGSTVNSINRVLKKSLKSHEDYVKKYDEQEINSLYRVIKRIKLIVLVVKTYERAFYLFETTNARGKELEPGDLLKNHLFRKTPESKRDDIYDRWDEVIKNSHSKLVIMLKHFYYVHGKHIQKKALYKSLKNLMHAEALLEAIEEYSTFHIIMHKGNRESFIDYLCDDLEIFDRKQETKKFDQLFLSASALRLFGSELTYPILFGFLNKFSDLLKNDPELKDQKKRDSFKKQLVEIFKALENFQFINYKIGGNKGNRIEIPYARFAGQIFRSENSFEFLCNLEKLYSFLRKEINSYEGFKENFISLSYEDRDNDLFKYIFHKIETFRNGGKEPSTKVFDIDRTKHKLFDIEHIAPRKLTVGQSSQEEFAEYNSTHEEITENRLIHNIGNLVIMHNTLNQDLSNKIPRVKKDFILKNASTSKYLLHSYLEDFTNIEGDWNSEMILDRAEAIANECYSKIFAIGESVNFPKISDNYLDKFKK